MEIIDFIIYSMMIIGGCLFWSCVIIGIFEKIEYDKLKNK